MFRTIFIITLILIAIPLFNKAKDYVGEKTQTAKNVGETVIKTIKYATGK
jgi:hypothetical protein